MDNLISKCTIDRSFLEKSLLNVEYNKIIINYYERFLKEIQGDKIKTITNKIENIKLCNKFWQIDKYKKQKIKDFKKTNLCRDKFCNNCKKVNQAARMAKYMPELKKYDDISYHLTLTSPTVSGEYLKDKIKLMAKSYRTLNLYITGKKKVNGFDFSSWKCKGSIRSLEVTFKDNQYHPHYHCLLLLEGIGTLDKTIINDYSYSYGELKNLYSKEEILIQKLWYLIINGIRITKKNIDSLDIGYSCKMDKLGEGDYNELFKYMTKEIAEDGQVLTYQNFKTLYYALYRVKQIQGYGLLYRITDEGDTESFIEEYQKIIDELQKVEIPLNVLETLEELLKDKDYTMISRSSYMKYMIRKED